MKCFAILVAAQLLGTAEAMKSRKPKGKTAFCISGNIRTNHGLQESLDLKKVMDDIDPNGLHFAYVNPCEQQDKPWEYDPRVGTLWKDQEYIPATCAADPWETSSWKSVLNPTVLKEYRDKDVSPPPHEKYCPDGKGGWLNGVYQQYKGMEECYDLIQQYEKENNFKFEWVVRMRADACSKAEGKCSQSKYCHVDKLDKSKAYMHFQNHKPSFRLPQAKGHLFDHFAIVPRKFATGFFKALEYWKRCDLGGPGETLMNYNVHRLMLKQWYYKEPMVVVDKCECHAVCPKEGEAWPSLLLSKRGLHEEEIVFVSEERENKTILPGVFAAINESTKMT